MNGECFAVLQVDGAWYRLAGPGEPLVAREPSAVAGVIAAAVAAAEAGGHAAGFVAFEAAAGFGIAAHQPAEGLPLAAFVVGRELEPLDHDSYTHLTLPTKRIE